MFWLATWAEIERRIEDDVASGFATRSSEPLVLYRSVSIPELVSVLRTGRIWGGQNRFNMFDCRPLVFFGDSLTDWLIGQGEHTHRQAYFASQFHDVYRDAQLALRHMEELACNILRELDSDRISYDPEQAFMLEFGNCGRLRHRALRPAKTRRKYRALFGALKQLTRTNNRLGNAHAVLVQNLEAEIDGWKAAHPFTSAVLVTRPIAGGLVYSTPAYQGGREYGFRPGQVTLGDIREIILIKDRRIVCRCASPGDAARLWQAVAAA